MLRDSTSTAQHYATGAMQIVNLTPAKVQGMRSPKRGLWTLVVMVAFLSGMRAQSPTAGEYQIKAAFLFNFAKFVEWPSSSFSDASAAMRICVLGQDPFGEELQNITREKIVNGRKLEVSNVIDLQQARKCQILFISPSEKKQMKQVITSLAGTSVLTVGESEGFAEQGGMINFVLEKSRVQFEVNRKVAEHAGLKISSKLLAVA